MWAAVVAGINRPDEVPTMTTPNTLPQILGTFISADGTKYLGSVSQGEDLAVAAARVAKFYGVESLTPLPNESLLFAEPLERIAETIEGVVENEVSDAVAEAIDEHERETETDYLTEEDLEDFVKEEDLPDMDDYVMKDNLQGAIEECIEEMEIVTSVAAGAARGAIGVTKEVHDARFEASQAMAEAKMANDRAVEALGALLDFQVMGFWARLSWVLFGHKAVR
jgi:flagellar hook-basal body complex protein FliE